MSRRSSRLVQMKANSHEPYNKARFACALVLQILLLACTHSVSPSLFRFFLLPSAIYLGVTVLLFCFRPRPTRLTAELTGVGGYACYLSLAGAVAAFFR